MIRCPEGHFYDPAKHTACPWCGVAAQAEPAKAEPAEGATRPLHRAASGISPVVGWLVCVEGPERGQDYRLHMEKNFIGRSSGMDIMIAGDDAVSREKHAAITFDPKKKMFWLQPGDSTGLAYLNEELVNTPAQIKADDVIELGKSKFVLVPFASKKFQWE